MEASFQLHTYLIFILPSSYWTRFTITQTLRLPLHTRAPHSRTVQNKRLFNLVLRLSKLTKWIENWTKIHRSGAIFGSIISFHLEFNGSEIIQELAQSGAEAPGPPYRQSWEDFGSASRHPAVISGSGRRRRLASSGGGAPGAANRKSVASSGAGDRHSALPNLYHFLKLSGSFRKTIFRKKIGLKTNLKKK